MRFLQLIFISVAVALLDIKNTKTGSQASIIKEFDECDVWAIEGECINNPNFMWLKCLSSCNEHAIDDNDNCVEWAKLGECTLNPSYIHVHCPNSCSNAISWSPWVRANLKIDPPARQEDIEVRTLICPVPTDILAAADIMSERLDSIIMHSGYSSVVEFSYSSPSEYLGVLGLIEAFLYSFRLYHIVIDSHGKTTRKDMLMSRTNLENLNEFIDRGWDSDILMRELPFLMKTLNKIATIAHHSVQHLADVNQPANECRLKSVGPTIEASNNDYGGLGISKALLPPKHRDQMNKLMLKNGNRDNLKLHNGVKLPILGLGTWQLEEGVCESTVFEAIRIGYRHIDTAQAYGNEVWVGWAIHHAIDQKLVTREELFIATKLSSIQDAGYENVKKLIQKQLKDLQVTYIDLYMLHSPMGELQLETWKALEELYYQGVIKAIGVSNFDIKDIENLMHNVRVEPMVIQNKLDIYHIGKQLDNKGDNIVNFGQRNTIAVVGYSPFSAYPFVMKPIHDPIVRYLANKYSVSSAQILLRWSMQLGLAVIPRTSNLDNLQDNYDSLSMTPLSEADMDLLSTLQYLVTTPKTKVSF